MTEKTEKKHGLAYRVVTLPLLPWRASWRSMKNTIGSGVETIKDINKQIEATRRNPKIRTFAEAMASRPHDAVPLAQIEKTCLINKRIALFFWLLSVAYTIGSVVPENYMGAVLGALFSIFCLLIALKYQHRLWQIRKGKASPDKPLGSVLEYMREPGWIKKLFSPEMFD